MNITTNTQHYISQCAAQRAYDNALRAGKTQAEAEREAAAAYGKASARVAKRRTEQRPAGG